MRYSKDALGEDLIFKKAGPIVGGREEMSNGVLEKSARPSESNNFQARYAIRHPWTGPIECKEPRRNRWGGRPPPPPSTEGGAPTTATSEPPLTGPIAAQKLAFVPRGGVSLGAMLTPSSIADLADAGVSVAAVATPTKDAEGDAGAKGASAPEKKKGCGCSVIDAGDGVTSASLGGALLAALGLRRRRVRRRD